MTKYPMPPPVANERVELVAVETLIPHPRNPNQGDVGAIAQSILAHGFIGAVIAQISTRHILAGEHSWLAAAQTGMSHIPTVWVDIDDRKALSFLLAHNRTRDRAAYDHAKLYDLLAELRDELGSSDDFEGATGFDDDALNALSEDLKGLTFPELSLPPDPGPNALGASAKAAGGDAGQDTESAAPSKTGTMTITVHPDERQEFTDALEGVKRLGNFETDAGALLCALLLVIETEKRRLGQ